MNAYTGNGKESGFIDQVPHTCTGHLTSYILSIFMITLRAGEFYYPFPDIKTDSEILSDLLQSCNQEFKGLLYLLLRFK